MRVFLDIIENLNNSIRHVVGMVMLCVMVLGLIFSLGASYVGTLAVDSLGERAERVSEQAIRTELESRSAEDLAKDGWGYPSLDKDRAAGTRKRDSAERLGRLSLPLAVYSRGWA